MILYISACNANIKNNGEKMQTQFKRKLRSAEKALFDLSSLYEGAGYEKYKMRKFEEYSLYSDNKSFLQSDHIITFSDIGGKLLALKPDVTLSIAKNYTQGEQTKVYYNENVYRLSRETKEYTEITQIGLELIGSADLYSMCEVLSLAHESLACLDENFIIEISHMGFISGLFEVLDLKDDAKKAVIEAINKKAPHELDRACAEYYLPAASAKLLKGIAFLNGNYKEVLEKASEYAVNAKMSEALKQLEDIYSVIGGGNYVLDFSNVNDDGYYNGIIFKGYINNVPKVVLSGGRYDKLMEKLGKKAQAIGFAVYLGEIEKYIKDDIKYDADVLLLYTDSDDVASVYNKAIQLKNDGLSVRVQKDIGKVRCKKIIRTAGNGDE